MKIKCDNGLCDRLRFIFSYLYKFKDEKLIVCWKINKKCNGHFLDLFQPIENLEFTENESNLDVQGWEPYEKLGFFKEGPSIKINIYKNLELLPEIKEKVFELKQKMGKYIALHVRRTDKSLRINNLTADEDFIEFAKNTKHNIFLATDCYYVQNKFKKIFEDRLFYFEKIKQPWSYKIEDCPTYESECPDFRPISLKSTAVDLFTCIYSYKFMGTNFSGMSDFIDFNHSLIKNKRFI